MNEHGHVPTKLLTKNKWFARFGPWIKMDNFCVLPGHTIWNWFRYYLEKNLLNYLVNYF